MFTLIFAKSAAINTPNDFAVCFYLHNSHCEPQTPASCVRSDSLPMNEKREQRKKAGELLFCWCLQMLGWSGARWKGERFSGSRLHNSSRDRNFSKPVFDDRWQRGIDENRAPKHKTSYAGLINITHTFQCSAQTPTRLDYLCSCVARFLKVFL